MKKVYGIILVWMLSMGMIFASYAGYAEEAGIRQDNILEEPDGSGIPRDEPVSTTGTAYGYEGVFNLDAAVSQKIELDEGAWDINNRQLIFWGTVIRNSGTSSLLVRDSYIRGETAIEAGPLVNELESLLISGNVRAVVALGTSQNYYINSTIASRNWAAIYTEDAQQVMDEGKQELGVYLYGSEAITMDGGFGANADLFSNLYIYGSHIQGAEAGVISGTYGQVNIGTIEDGEGNADLAMLLNQADRDKRSDKQQGCVIEGGRNALMIYSADMPEYRGYSGYSQEELPAGFAYISADKSVLRTDVNLDKDVEYSPQQQAYIDHTAGSVLLIKSTNAGIFLDECEIVPDEKGTGNLIQTVCTNDIQYGFFAPDGEYYPGIQANLSNMKLAGDIVHEDYQRLFNLVMEAVTLDGAINEYDCEHWNTSAAQEGFADYIPDAAYHTHHGLYVTLSAGSVWNVTQESHISSLEIGSDCTVNGVIFLNGIRQENVPGTTYAGDVIVQPAGFMEEGQQETTKQEETTQGQPETAKAQPETTAAQPETTKAQPETATTQPETSSTPPGSAEHEHNWKFDVKVEPDCVNPGYDVYVCTICGEVAYFNETAPTSHNYTMTSKTDPSCTDKGEILYECTKCGDHQYKYPDPLGHDWKFVSKIPADCMTEGYDIYQCSRCGIVENRNTVPANDDHDWKLISNVAPTCLAAGKKEYSCARCGKTYSEELAKTGHDWQLTSDITPTCTAMGQKVYTCKNCGEVLYEDLPETGHQFVFEYNVPVTCMMSGYDVYKCSVCGTEDWLNQVSAPGHDWQLISSIPATCITDGQNDYTCSRCGASYSEAIPKTGIHNYVYSYHQPADCVTDGYDVYECTVCGTEDWQQTESKTGHIYIVYPTPGAETITHTLECVNCGYSYNDFHDVADGVCGVCGQTGPWG